MSRIQIGMGFCGGAAIIVGGLMFLTPAQVGADQPTPAVGTWIEFIEPSPVEMCPVVDVVLQCPNPTSESSTTVDGTGDPQCDAPGVAAGVRVSIGNPDDHVACGPAVATDWNDIGGGCVQLRESHVVACAG